MALDIAEVFKPVIIDRVIFKVLNKKEIQEKHFDRKLNKCLLNQSGKKIFVKAVEDKLLETIKHRTLNRNVSYRHLIKLECYKSVSYTHLDVYKRQVREYAVLCAVGVCNLVFCISVFSLLLQPGNWRE